MRIALLLLLPVLYIIFSQCNKNEMPNSAVEPQWDTLIPKYGTGLINLDMTRDEIETNGKKLNSKTYPFTGYDFEKYTAWVTYDLFNENKPKRIQFRSGSIITSKSITFGSSHNNISAAYGDPDTTFPMSNDTSYEIIYFDIGISFQLLSLTNSVISITVESFDTLSNSSIELPVITLQPKDKLIALNQTATFMVGVPTEQLFNYKYQWQKNNDSIYGATSSLYITPPVQISDDSSTYRCIVSNEAGSDTSDAATLYVVQSDTPPKITVNLSNQSTTDGDSAIIRVSATGTNLHFQWEKNGDSIPGATDSILIIKKVSPADSGNYVCIIYNAAGTDTSDIMFLSVIPLESLPVITKQPLSCSKIEGQSVDFAVSASGKNLNFQWYKNGTAISDATGSNYSISAVKIEDNGNFVCIISNSSGKVTSDTALLTVTKMPTPCQITKQPVDTAVDEGKTATFSFAVNCEGTLQYQWQRNGANISGATSSTYSIQSVQYSDSGTTYRCIVENAAGKDTSNSATLFVHKVITPPVITQNPSNLTVNEGQSASFTVSATGIDLNFQWKKDGTSISGATTSTFSLTSAATTDNGTYVCVVNNSAGSLQSSSAMLTVTPTPPQITKEPVAVNINEGQNTTFRITATGGGTLLYQWQKDRVDIAGKTLDSLCLSNAVLSDSGNYRCIVMNSAGKDTSNEVKLKVIHVLPKFTLTTAVLPTTSGSVSLSPSGGTYDSGTVVTMTASPVSGYDFSSWSGSATGTSTSVTVTMSGNINVTANFTAHVLPKFTLSTTVQPTAGGSVSLSPSGGTYDSGTVVTVTASRASGYDFSSWSGSATGTSTSISVTMTEDKSVTANFSVHILPRYTLATAVLPAASGSVLLSPTGGTYDSGTVVTMTATPASGYNFSSWSGSATGTSTSASVTMTGSKSVTANFTLSITITSQPSDRTVSEGATATFSIVATGSSLSYQWKRNGTNVGSNSTSYSYTATLSRDGDEIWCVVSNTDGSVTSNSAYLTVIVDDDSYEFDDNPLYANTIVANGSSQSHSLTEDDEDWMRFYAIAGNVYTIQTTGNLDTYLELYNSETASTPSLSDDDGGSGDNARIVLPCLGTGYFWIRVLSEVGDTGDYSISVTSP